MSGRRKRWLNGIQQDTEATNLKLKMASIGKSGERQTNNRTLHRIGNHINQCVAEFLSRMMQPVFVLTGIRDTDDNHDDDDSDDDC